MTATKQDNIVFIEGKEKGLQTLFSTQNFGYLAVGRNTENDTNGFINVDGTDSTITNGFHEISLEEDSTYQRVPLNLHPDTIKNYDNGKVTVKFTAELDIDNIISNIPINQLAIVNTATVQDPSTIFYAAATCDDFPKSEKLALVFVIEMTI